MAVAGQFYFTSSKEAFFFGAGSCEATKEVLERKLARWDSHPTVLRWEVI
jgi:hypothetical protein